MRYLAPFALLLLAGCPSMPGGGPKLTPDQWANAWTCFSQIHALASSVQSQVPACGALADSIKSEPQP